MRFRLVPTDDRFFSLFNESARNAEVCAQRLLDLVQAPDSEQMFELVQDCERRGDQFTTDILHRLIASLAAAGAQAKVVAPRLGYLQTTRGNIVKIHFSLLTASSVLFDAVYVPSGEKSVMGLTRDPAALEFVSEAYKHAKALAASGAGAQLFEAAGVFKAADRQDEAIIVAKGGASEEMASQFVAAIAKHRNWQREKMLRVDLQLAGPRRKSA